MSIVAAVTDTVKALMAKHKESFERDAMDRVNARKEPPANEQEMKWALESEYNTIQSNLVQEQVLDKWTGMAKELIEQANSSYDELFVQAMVDAMKLTHKTIQSEFWLRMIKVMDKNSKLADSHFDPRNAWTKDVLARMIFAHTHSVEVDILRGMSENELWEFRTKNRK